MARRAPGRAERGDPGLSAGTDHRHRPPRDRRARHHGGLHGRDRHPRPEWPDPPSTSTSPTATNSCGPACSRCTTPSRTRSPRCSKTARRPWIGSAPSSAGYWSESTRVPPSSGWPWPRKPRPSAAGAAAVGGALMMIGLDMMRLLDDIISAGIDDGLFRARPGQGPGRHPDRPADLWRPLGPGG